MDKDFYLSEASLRNQSHRTQGKAGWKIIFWIEIMYKTEKIVPGSVLTNVSGQYG